MAEYSEAEIRDSLSRLGVKKDDCIFVHSGLKALGKFIPKDQGNQLEQLLNLFLDVVGVSGTVVVPTFNFAFCHGAVFNRHGTPCDGMGVFSEYVRKNKRSHRSKHPFHSIASVGKNAIGISDASGFSEFSEGSSFDLLLKLNCKVLFYGVPFVTTFVHVSEERAAVPYRFWKTFTGDVVEGESQKTIEVNFYAQKLDMTPEPRLDLAKISQFLRDKKIRG